MSNSVTVGNRQKPCKVNTPFLRLIAKTLLLDLLNIQSYDLAIYIVGEAEMARLNETFLNHPGSTDVLTFDYRETPEDPNISGELFICQDEAVIQARRFRTSWQSELVRYVTHGTLHLLGHDDHRAPARRMMKREENRLLKELARRFPFARMSRVERNKVR